MAASWSSFVIFTLLGSAIAHPFNDLSARAEAAWQKTAGHTISAPQCKLGPGEVAGTKAGGCAGGYYLDGLVHDCVCDLTASGSYYCLDTAFPLPLQHCTKDSDCPQGGACDITLGGICAKSTTCQSMPAKASTPSPSPSPSTPHTIDAPICKLAANEVAGTIYSGGCRGSFARDGVAFDCACDQAASGQYYCLSDPVLAPRLTSCKKDSDCPQGAACDVTMGGYCSKATMCKSSYA